VFTALAALFATGCASTLETYAGAGMNVCEVDEKGRPILGLCFVPVGELPIGDVVLSQKIALENCESGVLAVARRFVPNGFPFRPSRLLG